MLAFGAVVAESFGALSAAITIARHSRSKGTAASPARCGRCSNVCLSQAAVSDGSRYSQARVHRPRIAPSALLALDVVSSLRAAIFSKAVTPDCTTVSNSFAPCATTSPPSNNLCFHARARLGGARARAAFLAAPVAQDLVMGKITCRTCSASSAPLQQRPDVPGYRR